MSRLSGLSVSLASMLIVVIPVLTFEKLTFYLYLSSSAYFFTFSGLRLVFDITWFVVSGIMIALLFQPGRRAQFLLPLLSSGIFIIAVYLPPFCGQVSCYVSSPDGLAPLRLFLFLGAIGFVSTHATVRLKIGEEVGGRASSGRGKAFSITFSALLGFVIGYYPLIHILSGATVVFPLNYLQWFLAAAPAGFVGTWMAMVELGDDGLLASSLGGLSGTFLALLQAVTVPCPECSGYLTVGGSVAGVCFLSSVLAYYSGVFLMGHANEIAARNRELGRAIAAAAILVLLSNVTFFFAGIQASVTSDMGAPGVAASPLEVGHSQVYGGGYLSSPRVVTQGVGVTVSFGNSSPPTPVHNYLAAGVGVQCPNCCTDGLDMAYRIDAVLFGNGSQAVLARAWKACDTNVACGGYTWQDLLFSKSYFLPAGTLSGDIGLEMKWVNASDIAWYYGARSANGAGETWTLFAEFTPPPNQNHYFDAGVYPVGLLNPPGDDAYFYQFGVSSAYPVTSAAWRVTMSCPSLEVDGSSICIPTAAYVSGSHSYWKVIYSFGMDYPGLSYAYMGDYTVVFQYSGRSPPDSSSIW